MGLGAMGGLTAFDRILGAPQETDEDVRVPEKPDEDQK
jgi:hypothetical protein